MNQVNTVYFHLGDGALGTATGIRLTNVVSNAETFVYDRLVPENYNGRTWQMNITLPTEQYEQGFYELAFFTKNPDDSNNYRLKRMAYILNANGTFLPLGSEFKSIDGDLSQSYYITPSL